MRLRSTECTKVLCPFLYKFIMLLMELMNFVGVSAGMKCSDCGFNAHEDCVPKIPKQCVRKGSTKEPSTGPSRPTSDEVVTAGTPVTPAGVSGMVLYHWQSHLYKMNQYNKLSFNSLGCILPAATLKVWHGVFLVLNMRLKHSKQPQVCPPCMLEFGDANKTKQLVIIPTVIKWFLRTAGNRLNFYGEFLFLFKIACMLMG